MKTTGFDLLEPIPRAADPHVPTNTKGNRKSKKKQKAAQAGFKALRDAIVANSAGTSVLHYHSIALFREDVGLLLPGNWFNDNNIAFAYEWLEHTHRAPETSLVFPSIVQLLVHFPLLDDLGALVPTKDTNYVFLPLNDTEDFQGADLEAVNTGDHWLLCVYSTRSRRLYVYDSADDTNDELLAALAARLERATNAQNVAITKMVCDQQPNEDDCGVYVVMITCALMSQITAEEANNETQLLDILSLKFDATGARRHMMSLIHMLQDEKRNGGN